MLADRRRRHIGRATASAYVIRRGAAGRCPNLPIEDRELIAKRLRQLLLRSRSPSHGS